MTTPPTFGRRGLAAPVVQPPSRAAPEEASVTQERCFSSPEDWRRAEPARSRQAVWSVFSFEGRIPRLHYWLGKIGVIVFYQVITLSSRAIRASLDTGGSSQTAALVAIPALLILLAGLGAGVWASVALTVKRWHDRGKSGTWAWLGLVPIAGWLWQGIECGFLEGTLGPNAYGPSPKGIAGVMYRDSLAETFA